MFDLTISRLKRYFGNREFGTFMKRRAIHIILASLAYGFFNYLSSRYNLPGSSFVELRPQVALPMFIGFIYGPGAGFIVGCAGDRLGYGLQGMNILHAWNWGVGNGLIGMIPGLMHFQGTRRIETLREFRNAMILIIMASSIPILFASIIDVLVQKLGFMQMVYTLILPAFITDAVFGILIVPVLLIAAKKLLFTIETRNAMMITYLVMLSVLITYFAGAVNMWGEGMSDVLSLHALYNIGILSLIVLIAGLAASLYLVRRVTSPVKCLTDAAERIAEGDYKSSQELEETAKRQDELGRLASVFREMMNKVYAREKKLQEQVRAMKIEIDKAGRDREVKKITGTDYFKDLKRKAKELRSKNEEEG